MSGYKEIEPIEYPIAADRQAAKRHYGVHPYFTRRSVNLPPDVPLPRSSDADTLYDLFMPTQLIGLAILKEEIDKIGPQVAQSAMLLAWSATLAKLNKTFLSAAGRLESRGGSSI